MFRLSKQHAHIFVAAGVGCGLVYGAYRVLTDTRLRTFKHAYYERTHHDNNETKSQTKTKTKTFVDEPVEWVYRTDH